MAIIYISHRMAEVWLSDWVSVRAMGMSAAWCATSSTRRELVRMMVGRRSAISSIKNGHSCGQPRLRVEDLTDGGKIKPSSLVVHAAKSSASWLVGAGRSELAQLIFGCAKPPPG